MKKVWIISLVFAAVAGTTIEAAAQLRPIRLAFAGAQIRKNNRVPLRQRGVNGPLGDPQLGPNRGLNPNQIKRRQLQQRVMQSLGLTQDQRLRMQEIRHSHDDDIIAAGRRVRQARQALDAAIMSEPYNEATVRRAIDTLASAQADKVRLEAGVRAQVRGVLTPDQVLRFNRLQREMRREMREQQREQIKEPGPRGMGSPEADDFDLLAFLFQNPALD